jgi:hypothetical protein
MLICASRFQPQAAIEDVETRKELGESDNEHDVNNADENEAEENENEDSSVENEAEAEAKENENEDRSVENEAEAEAEENENEDRSVENEDEAEAFVKDDLCESDDSDATELMYDEESEIRDSGFSNSKSSHNLTEARTLISDQQVYKFCKLLAVADPTDDETSTSPMLILVRELQVNLSCLIEQRLTWCCCVQSNRQGTIAREVSSVLDCGASMIRTASRNIFFAKENPEISEVSEVVNPVSPFDCRELVARTMLRLALPTKPGIHWSLKRLSNLNFA